MFALNFSNYALRSSVKHLKDFHLFNPVLCLSTHPRNIVTPAKPPHYVEYVISQNICNQTSQYKTGQTE